METIKWVFSGIGVAILFGVARLVYTRVRGVRAAEAGAPTPEKAPETSAPSVEGRRQYSKPEWVDQTVRIRVGDYFDFRFAGPTIRIGVTDIRTAPVSLPGFPGSVSQELCAELTVEGGIPEFTGGPKTTRVAASTFLIPPGQFPQAEKSLFSFVTVPSELRFARITVVHINPQDRLVEVNFAGVSLSFGSFG